MQKYNKYFLIVITTLAFFSCKDTVKYDVNVSDIDCNIKIVRFDKELNEVTKKNYRKKLDEIKAKHPDMLELYVERIALAGRVNDTLYKDRIKPVLTDKYVKELYRDVFKKYPDLSDIEDNLCDAFRHVKYYFPDDTFPEVYSMVTNMSGLGCVTYQNILAFSLDMFLGEDYVYYPSRFPDYKIRTLRKEYVTSEMMKTYFGKKFPEDEFCGKTMLSKMIYYGKRLFFLDIMMPDLSDSIKISYTQDELEWCESYEGEVWNEIVKSKALYESDDRKVFRYFSEGPFTNVYGIPHDSPARLGEWVGWQIVRNFVRNMPDDYDITKVFFEKNDQKILTLAKYKPKI